jgi:hypothetical protein
VGALDIATGEIDGDPEQNGPQLKERDKQLLPVALERSSQRARPRW